MQDREFEKQVRQKMQELRFAPNTDVWARVQADIRKKKRRRPLIIFLLLAGLLAGSAWVYFGVNWNPGKEQVGKAQATSDMEQGGSIKEQIINDKEEINNNKQIAQPVTEVNIDKNNRAEVRDVSIDKSISVNSNNISKRGLASATQKNKPQASDEKKEPSLNELLENNASWLHIKQPEPIKAKSTPSVVFDSTSSDKQAKSDSVKPDDTKKPIDSLAKKPFGAKTNNNKKKNWEFGASAGVGYANAKQELSFAKSLDRLFSNAAIRDSFSFSPEVKGNIALNVGGYASKRIGKRLNLKAGLNYEYYSTSMQVGRFVDSSRAVNLSSGSLGMVDNYYRSGDQNKYTNKYHFISVPVSIQWQVNRNAKRSIIWENGISLARLIAAKSLQYDPVTSSYYRDKSQQNKTQWMASSAVLFRFATKNNRHVYAGPTVQYAFTNLTKDSDNKHLRYAGLKMMMSLNKK